MTTQPDATTDPTATIEVRVLGPLQLLVDGESLPMNGQKLRTLVGILALHAGQVVSADLLVEAIYGDDLPKHIDNALQAQVSTLRRALRARGICASFITNDQAGYRLQLDRSQVDALRFVDLVRDGRARHRDGDAATGSELLHRALDLWQGPALVALPECDEITGERVRLEELRLSALEDCIGFDLEIGEQQRWSGELERLVAANPLRERLWAFLMVVQYRSGRQADALRSFQLARRHLTEQLGVAPGDELRRIEAAVLAQDPALADPRRSAASTVASPVVSPVASARRGDELAGRRQAHVGRCRHDRARRMDGARRPCISRRDLIPPEAA